MLVSAFLVTIASANAQPASNENFEQAKGMATQMLDKRIAELQAHKDCVTKAKNHEEMHACRMEMRHERQEMRSEMKEMHEKMKEERKEKTK